MYLNKLIKGLNNLLKSGKLEVEEMEVVRETIQKLINIKNYVQQETGRYD